jgi:hypothetical protein
MSIAEGDVTAEIAYSQARCRLLAGPADIGLIAFCTTIYRVVIKEDVMKVAKTLGFVGVAAGVALGVYGTTHAPAPAVAPVASSGHGASSGVYNQPTVADINMGATATPTTPSSVEPVTVASPPVKAKPYSG